MIDLEGRGSVSLQIPVYISKEVNDIVYAESGKSIPFIQSVDQKSETITLNFTTGWYPRLVNIEHDKPAVNASVSTDHCGGRYNALFPYAGQNSTLYVTVDNNNPTTFNGEVLVKIRDVKSHSWFERSEMLNMTGKETLCIPFDWLTPNPYAPQGTYDLEVIVQEDSIVSITRSKLFVYVDP